MAEEGTQAGQGEQPEQPAEKPAEKPKARRGGARPGAGRKRHEQRNARAVMEAERKLQEAFDDILEMLITEATEKRNWKVGIYLADRLMGKPTERVEQKEAKDEQKTAMEAALDELAADGWDV